MRWRPHLPSGESNFDTKEVFEDSKFGQQRIFPSRV